MIAVFSVTVVLMKNYEGNTKPENLSVQTDLKAKKISSENFIKEHTTSIDFEIDTAIEEMNQKLLEIDLIIDTKEWFISYKNILDEYSYIIDKPGTIYDCFTDEEIDLLFHVVQAEVGDEYSFEQK